MADGLMLVATIGDEIIGAANLHADTVRGMYVRPGKGRDDRQPRLDAHHAAL
jgi:hypothetical protein